MRSKGDLYRRKQAIINKAQTNELVSHLMEQYYSQLQHLIKCDADRDVFNDTYLALTISYRPCQSFVEEFTRLFNNTKIEYQKKGAQMQQLLTSLEDTFYPNQI